MMKRCNIPEMEEEENHLDAVEKETMINMRWVDERNEKARASVQRGKGGLLLHNNM